MPLAVVVKIGLGKGFKSRNRKIDRKATEIIQEHNFSGFDHCGNSGEGKKRLGLVNGGSVVEH